MGIEKVEHPRDGLLEVAAIESVARSRQNVKFGVGIGLGSLLGIAHWHDAVLVAVNDEHRPRVARDVAVGVEVEEPLEVGASQRHAPEVVGVGDAVLRAEPLHGVVGNAQGGIEQDGGLDVR